MSHNYGLRLINIHYLIHIKGIVLLQAKSIVFVKLVTDGTVVFRILILPYASGKYNHGYDDVGLSFENAKGITIPAHKSSSDDPF
jgi:hypothetical protein